MNRSAEASLKTLLEYQRYFGVDLSFDFITGRDWRSDINATAQKTKSTQTISNDSVIKNDVDSFENYSQQAILTATSNENLNSVQTFDELCDAITNFNGCDLKKSGATSTVIYDGNPKAKIMLIGEAPGETEDRLGKPFCGESGQLLRKALKFINLDTNNLLITNTVFWRPPLNRTPNDEEIKLCYPFLQKMIEIVDPTYIILCGSTAMKALLGTKEKITDIAGEIKNITLTSNKTIKAFVVYHPSYLLRSPAKKKDFWEHLLKIRKTITATL